jgi:ADP-dependent NAD(P)H-hydrate dehydratase / NAD(P)H-hydrate epimerase
MRWLPTERDLCQPRGMEEARDDAVAWVAATAEQTRVAEEPVLDRVGEDPLMDRAADAVAAEARTMLGGAVEGRTIVILAGTGNNGGDALLAGASLARDGATVTAVLTGSAAHLRGLERLTAAGGSTLAAEGFTEKASAQALAGADLVIDGIVGIGAKPGLREPAASLVASIPDRTPVLSVDLPSGLDPDSAQANLPHVRAAATVTFTTPKPCLLLPPAALDAGRIVVAQVGIPEPETDEDAPRRLTPLGAARLWPVPGPTDHKYSRGVVGIVAGSERYPGAAVLACSAAVRSGAGMVRYLGPSRVRDLVVAARPEVVADDPPSTSGGLPDADAWVIGPGVGDDPGQVSAMEKAVKAGSPLVVDADAVAWFVRRGQNHPTSDPDAVLLTPHAGELARALKAIGVGVIGGRDEPLKGAGALAAATNTTVLLKGAVTLIVRPTGSPWSQAEAPAWLATAGAGDVLAGVAGTLMAAGLPADKAGALAALVHGRAAALASGGGPVAALDVADALPRTVEALREAITALLTDPASSPESP